MKSFLTNATNNKKQKSSVTMKKNINTILIIFCLSVLVFNVFHSRSQRKEFAEEIIKSNDSLITVIHKYSDNLKK